MIKRLCFFILIIFVIIQFFRPPRNQSTVLSGNDITLYYKVPDEALNILKQSCYDCHSNHTAYPWYFRIQPVAWWMQDHVDDGKREINFSEFATYAPRKQVHKMKEVSRQIKQGEMPLDSYLWIHKDAKLDDGQKSIVIRWADSLSAYIMAKYKLPEEPERGKD
jgi:Haem-binding domain